MAEIKDLIGVTLTSVDGHVGDEQIAFKSEDGRTWRMYHSQDCCERVYVQDIAGDMNDLIGRPIIQAEESSNSEDSERGEGKAIDDSFTWTFYRISTDKGLVVIRWLGESSRFRCNVIIRPRRSIVQRPFV